MRDDVAADAVRRVPGMSAALESTPPPPCECSQQFAASIADHSRRLTAIEGQISAVGALVSGAGKRLIVWGIVTLSTFVGGGYWATNKVTTQSRAQAAAVATTVTREDSDARLARLLDDAERRWETRRNVELEAARIAQERRIVRAERAASMMGQEP